MARDAGYREAERRIEEARQLGKTGLDLSGRALQSIPESIKELRQLQSLDVSQNHLSYLPDWIGDLTSLRALLVHDNQLTSLPKRVGNLRDLRALSLSDNNFATFPQWLGQITSLKRLNISRNRLTAIPEWIGSLSSLTLLESEGNQLLSLPDSLNQLAKLEKLVLNHNRLAELPAWFGQLDSLTYLFLSNNWLTKLPFCVGKLTHLLKLHVDGNRLSRLPTTLGKLEELEELDVSDNRLTAFPEVIGSLARLQKLKADANHLVSLPQSVANLSWLTSISLRENRIAQLPTVLRKMTSLRELNLSSNCLVELPEWIGEMSGLTQLWVSRNQLTSVPASIGKLTNLSFLAIDENLIESLPASVGHLSGLHNLSATNNNLVSLPRSLGQLTTLTTLEVGGNPLRVPPDEIVAQGTTAILTYLRDLADATKTAGAEQPIHRHEAKLVLVGWGDVGKSCLVANLRGEDPRNIKGATQGVEVRELPRFDHPNLDSAQIKLVAWDFGGQEIDHATHRFFMTRRSLYLVLWKPREATEEEHVQDWLRSIALYSPGARVLLVATHADAEPRNPCRLDFEAIRAEYGPKGDEPARLVICDRLHHVDNFTGRGLNELREAIQREAQHVSGLEDEWLPSWIRAEETLKEDERHEITQEQMLDICRQEGVKEETVRAFLAGWWHELGKILYFPDDAYLSRRVVLKPNWVTKAISRVMRDDKIALDGGVLDERDLNTIWNVEDAQGFGPFGEEYYEPFLRLMHRFGLSYNLPKEHALSARRFLVPFLLPTVPSPEALAPPESPEGRPQLLYRFGLLPPGLMSRIIVELNLHVHRDAHWRSGVVLEDAGNFVRAETYNEAGQTVLRLTGWGQYHPYGFFTRVRDNIDRLLEDYKGREVRIDVPCPTPNCRGTFTWKRLDGKWRAIQEGKLDSSQENEFCVDCAQSHSIAQILYGIHPSSNALLAARIEELLEKVSAMRAGQEEARRTLQEIGRQMQWEYQSLWQRMGGKCPGLFRIMPSTRSDMSPKEQVGTSYRLLLCCQWPEGVHECAPPYEVFDADPWLRGVGSLAGKAASIVKLLKGHVSAVNEIAGSFVDDAQPIQDFLGRESALTSVMDMRSRKLADAVGESIAVDGAAVSTFYDWLVKQPGPRFRDLAQYPTPGDGVLWLCTQHHAEAVKRWGEYGQGD